MSGVERFLPGPGDALARTAGASGDDLARRVRAAREAGDDRSLAEAARELESLFSTFLVRELRRGLAGGFFGEGPGADTYSAWLDEHLGGRLAEAGALDLGRVLAEASGPRWDRLAGDVLAERLAERARGTSGAGGDAEARP